MSIAKFVFHGMYPDVPKNQKDAHQTSDSSIRSSTAILIKVVFDVEFEDLFHSHLMADIEQIEQDGQTYFEVRRRLPFLCDDFPQASVEYYTFITGTQAQTISHSGPKGASIASNNVVRAEWSIMLSAEPLVK